jgi:hypothetical protein
VFKSPRHEFDPLDREILERAFYAAWATVKETDRSVAFGGDESLASVLRSKLQRSLRQTASTMRRTCETSFWIA